MDTIERLDEILEDHNMSLYELSKESGIHYSTFGATKRRNGQLSVDTIEKICETLGMRPYEFFMTEDDWAEFERYCQARSEVYASRAVSASPLRV